MSITKLKVKTFIEQIVFNVRWVLNLFYFGLIVVLFLFAFAYAKDILHLFKIISSVTTDEMKVLALDTIDVAMIANLIKMIIAGSYNSFISKKHGYDGENISSGMLKIKISTSIIVVASIHLLQNFVSKDVNWDILYKQLSIYVVFLISAIVLGMLEFLHVKQELMDHETNKEHV